MRRNQGTASPIERRFVSELELEQLTGIPRRTWQKHRLFNRLPKFYRLHGSIRYDLYEVMEWIRSNAAGGDQPPKLAVAAEQSEPDAQFLRHE
jgi:predicted DNA-binding transcriptional regulator AlpA